MFLSIRMKKNKSKQQNFNKTILDKYKVQKSLFEFKYPINILFLLKIISSYT